MIENKTKNNKTLIIISSIIVVLLVSVGLIFSTLNRFNAMKQDVDAQYSQVQTVMQRRYDLIPNMTAAVKGSMKHEEKVFTDLAKARSNYAGANTRNAKMKANEQVSKQMNNLISVINERYPKLASNDRVHDLMIELEGSENRINQERRHYIQKVQAYNTAVNNYPGKIIATAGGYTPIEYYQGDENAQRAPKVDLN